MKALTLTQPWATLVAIGAKRIETRSWPTSHRGPLAIHAAKGFPKWAREFTIERVCYEAVKACQSTSPARLWSPAYPVGVVVATCELIDCVQMREFSFEQGVVATGIGKYTHMLADNANEREFGDYSPGRWAWILSAVKCFEQPVPAKGALGIWEWTR